MIIGSHALREYGIKTIGRTPKDLDVILLPQELEDYKKSLKEKLVYSKETRWGETLFIQGTDPVEVEIARPGSSAEELVDIIDQNSLSIRCRMGLPWGSNFRNVSYVASPDVILALKLTHRYLKNSPHFYKTMDDIRLLRRLGYKVPECLAEWVKKREAETLDYKHPVLDQSKNNFFGGDGVNYVYDHDSIHEAVKIFDVPAFQKIKIDAADVLCSKEKFEQQSMFVRIATVLEEAYVLALERHQIPNNFKPDPRKSFDIAMVKICTSIASGWWREFAWENFETIEKFYDSIYINKFWHAQLTGMLLPYRSDPT